MQLWPLVTIQKGCDHPEVIAWFESGQMDVWNQNQISVEVNIILVAVIMKSWVIVNIDEMIGEADEHKQNSNSRLIFFIAAQIDQVA